MRTTEIRRKYPEEDIMNNALRTVTKKNSGEFSPIFFLGTVTSDNKGEHAEHKKDVFEKHEKNDMPAPGPKEMKKAERDAAKEEKKAKQKKVLAVINEKNYGGMCG